MTLEERRAHVHTVLHARGLDGVIVRRPPNFAWYTNGGDNRVDHSSPVGVADVVITPTREFVLTNNIEARRMAEEEAPGFEIVEYPWYDDGLDTLRRVVPGRVGADVPGGGLEDIGDEIDPLRWVLDEEARYRYVQVGRDAERALAEAASSLEPGVSELEAAAAVAGACRRADLFSPVILAAADDRISNFRHPLPGAHTARERLMLVLCAERGGLYANLTQFVHFEGPSPDLRRRFEACIRILDRTREEATLPGRTLAGALSDIKRFYADEGFPDEWTLHHQGGSTGYASREVVATPRAEVTIGTGMAFAWNPSIRGGKAEETFLLTEDGPRVLARGALLPPP